ncbi:MAG: lamin tail domain-containing protein [bacterium]
MPTVIFSSEAEKIDINTAPLEDLIKIIHLGEIRATELISLRPFSSLDELSRINGISESRVEEIKDQGIAFVQVEEQEKENLTEEIFQGYPKNIVFNELLPSPEGPDTENEWIELFNKNDFEVDLSNWQIIDVEGTTKIFTFPLGKIIDAKGYIVLYRRETQITLNNSKDGLKLLNPLGETIDSVIYENAENKKSLSLIKDYWIWNTKLTPGDKNIYNEEKKIVLENEGSQIKNVEDIKTVTTNVKQSNNYTFVAMLIALISAISILLLKKNVRIN